MSLLTLVVLAAGLSMDAFAVAVCKGLALKKANIRQAGLIGLWFGGFQAGMPLLGYLLGAQFKDRIAAIDHWIAFVLLAFIGGSMMKEAFSKGEQEADACLKCKTMFLLAVATSIDALAIGVTFAFLEVNILAAVVCIGIITFILSAAGVWVGSIFGTKYKARAELMGGLILILLGIKILAEHLTP